MTGAPETKWATIEGRPEVIERYLPGNYKVVGYIETSETIFTYIEGEDSHGWTLDEYVKPRLASGLYFGLMELTRNPFEVTDPEPITPWPKDE
jgi:hypothetical protein